MKTTLDKTLKITLALWALNGPASAQLYDLAADWSDTTNPFGVWSLYKSETALFTINQPDYFQNGTGQRAWADQPFQLNAHVPVWYGSGSPRVVQMHGAELDRTGTAVSKARWTSPANGAATVRGSVYMPNSQGRRMGWQLRKNGTVLSAGEVYDGDPYDAANPFRFELGSGGAAVLRQPVTTDDFIELAFISLSQNGNLGEFVIVDLRVELVRSCVPPPSGLVGWWPGDGHTYDLAGGNNGTLQNGATARAAGLAERAFQFDGLDDVLALPNTKHGALDLTNQQLTVAAWINLVTTNQPFGLGHGIFDKYWDTAQNGYILQVYLGRLQLGLATGDQPNFWLTAGPVMPTNQWVHVAGAYDGSRACLYMNGAEVASAALTGHVLHNDRDAVIGNDNTGSTQYGFNGKIDEVAIFNRGLAAGEIAALSAAGSAGMCQPSSPPGPVDFFDDFSSGVNSNLWLVISTDPLYTLNASQGDIRFSRPAGGNYARQTILLAFDRVVQGDFDASVDFRDANITRVDGSPGNQVFLTASFGGQEVTVVRSEEAGTGHNAHVWHSPPGAATGMILTAAASGAFRLTRVGTTVTAYFDGAVLHSGSSNTNDVTNLAFHLQNNGTRDATSVVFDNFHLQANRLVPKPVRLQALGGSGNQFQMRLLNPTPGAWHWIESTPVLPASGSWIIRDRLTGGAFPTNWSDPLPPQTSAGFYRSRTQ